ncbi:MAG: hypothetical protein EOO41_00910 [Methanobacteriota archaeon]|nr:MAG: hypothetical protein EOO41_00910 [Euryarchaeota archaeon]
MRRQRAALTLAGSSNAGGDACAGGGRDDAAAGGSTAQGRVAQRSPLRPTRHAAAAPSTGVIRMQPAESSMPTVTAAGSATTSPPPTAAVGLGVALADTPLRRFLSHQAGNAAGDAAGGSRVTLSLAQHAALGSRHRMVLPSPAPASKTRSKFGGCAQPSKSKKSSTDKKRETPQKQASGAVVTAHNPSNPYRTRSYYRTAAAAIGKDAKSKARKSELGTSAAGTTVCLKRADGTRKSKRATEDSQARPHKRSRRVDQDVDSGSCSISSGTYQHKVHDGEEDATREEATSVFTLGMRAAASSSYTNAPMERERHMADTSAHMNLVFASTPPWPVASLHAAAPAVASLPPLHHPPSTWPPSVSYNNAAIPTLRSLPNVQNSESGANSFIYGHRWPADVQPHTGVATSHGDVARCGLAASTLCAERQVDLATEDSGMATIVPRGHDLDDMGALTAVAGAGAGADTDAVGSATVVPEAASMPPPPVATVCDTSTRQAHAVASSSNATSAQELSSAVIRAREWMERQKELLSATSAVGTRSSVYVPAPQAAKSAPTPVREWVIDPSRASAEQVDQVQGKLGCGRADAAGRGAQSCNVPEECVHVAPAALVAVERLPQPAIQVAQPATQAHPAPAFMQHVPMHDSMPSEACEALPFGTPARTTSGWRLPHYAGDERPHAVPYPHAARSYSQPPDLGERFYSLSAPDAHDVGMEFADSSNAEHLTPSSARPQQLLHAPPWAVMHAYPTAFEFSQPVGAMQPVPDFAAQPYAACSGGPYMRAASQDAGVPPQHHRHPYAGAAAIRGGMRPALPNAGPLQGTPPTMVHHPMPMTPQQRAVGSHSRAAALLPPSSSYAVQHTIAAAATAAQYARGVAAAPAMPQKPFGWSAPFGRPGARPTSSIRKPNIWGSLLK